MKPWIVFILGVLTGVAAAFLLKIARTKSARQIADEMLREVESKFGSLSLDALSKSTNELLKLSKSLYQTEREQTSNELDTKKELIDQQLESMSGKLEEVSQLVTQLEKDREEKFGRISVELKNTNDQTAMLLQKTTSLTEVLSGSKSRGQLGEWMAEDVLRVAGFVENINYVKQKAIEGIGSGPDFTFSLPKNLKLNMDVKFPYGNYEKYLTAEAEADRERYKSNFFKDVKARIKEVTTRDYINPEQNTVDCVILFVPNEQIYAFIHQHERAILDTGLKNRVVFCSPITLFAVLAIIRQSVDNFSLEQTSNEILSLLGAFKTQWLHFLRKLEVVGKRIEDAQKEYLTLTTTRKNQLERPLNKIEALRQQKGLPILEEEPTAELIGENEERAPEEIQAFLNKSE